MMAYTEDDMLKFDREDLSPADLLVLFISGNSPALRTRIQKISFLYDEIYNKERKEADHHAYFFGGYSDDIEESMENLVDMGVLDEGRDGYVLTEYGKALTESLMDQKDQREKKERIDRIKNALSNVADRRVVGLTYRFYEETASNSAIRSSVERMNLSSKIDGKFLLDVDKEEFENYLRTGKPINMTS
ncbi:MAG: hypothetical protein LBJ20_02280 [Candidatus Methanoplasma sp.]|jgi:uncharacterized protein YwgA|nr:hypothetical protein [Candidatus Methanoplasma sp.]